MVHAVARGVHGSAGTDERSPMRPIDEYLDEKTLMDLAAAKDFLDGASAAEHGSVRILEHDDQHLKAEVDDTDVYVAELHLHADELAWSCSCGQADERLCRHLVAAALSTWPDEPAVQEVEID
jgi:uncharacterized Zn finger protein